MEGKITISANIVIMTKDELEAVKHAAFQRGVRRGEFEVSLRNAARDVNVKDKSC